jgi:tetratricopeptide (TPR) repeat protein
MRRVLRRPESRAVFVALAVALALSTAGCSRLRDYTAVINGNRLHARGLYQEAAAAYLSLKPGVFGPILSFDLANVYARLGEYEAAAGLYAEVRKSGDGALTAAAWYNQGLLLYEKGRYAEAYGAFRAALAFDPRDADARRNLELAWRDWRKKAVAPPEGAAQSERTTGGTPDQDLLILRRLETGRFLPGSRAASPPSPEDY